MKEEKNIIFGKDLYLYMGYNYSTNKIEVLPFIFNKDRTKIKILSDNNILNRAPLAEPYEAIENKYNLTSYFMYNSYYKYKTISIFPLYKENEKITKEKLEKIVSRAKKLYQRHLDKNVVKQKIEEQKRNKTQERYKNF